MNLSKEFLQELTRERTPEEEVAAEAAAEKARIKSAEEWQKKCDEDARLAVPREVAKLRKEAAEKIAQAEKIEALLKEFPALRQRTGRWNKVAYYAKEANSKANRFDLRHNCGCCQDSPLEVWPYFESPAGNVYSEPPMFRVGEKEPYYGGDIPRAGWDTEMREAGLPEDIIGAVSMHFKREAKAAKEAASEIYGEES